jgi:hypothetical protein
VVSGHWRIHDNFRPYSPQTSDVSRGQPDTHGLVDLPIDGVLVLKVEREALLGERVQCFIQSWDRLSPIDPQRELAKRLRPDGPAAGDSLEPVAVEEPVVVEEPASPR